jgi:hypothetical protein
MELKGERWKGDQSIKWWRKLKDTCIGIRGHANQPSFPRQDNDIFIIAIWSSSR